MSYFFYTLIPLEFLIQFILSNIPFPVFDIALASLLSDFISVFIPFLLLLLTGRKFLKAEWQKIQSKKRLILSTFLTFLLIALISYLCSLIIYAPVPEKELTINKVSPLTILLSTSSIMAAFIEEVSFRYLFLKNFSGYLWKSWLLLIVSSVLFGFLHIFVTQSLIATIPYMFLGLVLGIQYIRNKSIWYPIATHIVNNFVANVLPLIILYFRQLN